MVLHSTRCRSPHNRLVSIPLFYVHPLETQKIWKKGFEAWLWWESRFINKSNMQQRAMEIETVGNKSWHTQRMKHWMTTEDKKEDLWRDKETCNLSQINSWNKHLSILSISTLFFTIRSLTGAYLMTLSCCGLFLCNILMATNGQISTTRKSTPSNCI